MKEVKKTRGKLAEQFHFKTATKSEAVMTVDVLREPSAMQVDKLGMVLNNP